MTIVTLGPILRFALEARQMLVEGGIDAGVVDLRFASPLDAALLRQLASSTKAVLLAEETTRSTGLYDAVFETLVGAGMAVSHIGRCGVPDAFPVQDKRGHLLKTYHLDTQGMAEAARSLVTGAAGH